ncbi:MULTISPECIES: glyoxalase/bleomycin resistance/dioxygenase family protein [unclassified Amycolatopsis]|uniref:glyoxalase/bleomycin resistance/dioxygenase family protein n=1 Tax=Amycolatopsis TaxID=1813 RepID=UPI00026280F0|nr:glyoxalase/bleomycin resistance/dioxygenase family protein [Amycolatopsis sp. ATCC 39116]
MRIVHDALVRVEVDDLDSALGIYRALAGTDDVTRFRSGDIDLAWVGRFLLLAGPTAELARVRRTATLLVEDIDAARTLVAGSGGEILEIPSPGPNGARMIARHADGAVFEYIETPRRDGIV